VKVISILYFYHVQSQLKNLLFVCKFACKETSFKTENHTETTATTFASKKTNYFGDINFFLSFT